MFALPLAAVFARIVQSLAGFVNPLVSSETKQYKSPAAEAFRSTDAWTIIRLWVVVVIVAWLTSLPDASRATPVLLCEKALAVGPGTPCSPCGPVAPVAPFAPAGPVAPVAPVAPRLPLGPRLAFLALLTLATPEPLPAADALPATRPTARQAMTAAGNRRLISCFTEVLLGVGNEE